MDYSWIEVAKKSLTSIRVLAQKLQDTSIGTSLSDLELRAVVGEIEENTSRVSRLLSLERDHEIKELIPSYYISAQDLGTLTPDIDDEVRKALLRGDKNAMESLAHRLFAATTLWNEKIIQPVEAALKVLNTDKKDISKEIGELPSDCRVVLLVGAGASKPLQIPTMAEFWPILLANSHSEEENLALELLLETAKDETTSLPPDLEKLFEMVDRYETFYRILWEDANFGFQSHALQFILPYQPLLPWFRENPRDQFLRKCGHASRGISWIKTNLSKMMEAFYTKQFDQSEVLALYQPIFSFLGDGLGINNIVVFTTNYDTVIEQYCRYSGLKLVDGFQKSGPNLIWNPVEYYKGTNPSQKSVTLFKLHGSLTWKKIGNEIFEFGMSAESMPGGKALIYPTETKEYPFEEPFKSAYKSLDSSLKKAEFAIVIGYSFRDRGIMTIIDEAQSMNPNLKFIVICGHAPGDNVRNRFPYGSHPIENDFKPGDDSEYLIRLKAILNRAK